MTNKFLPVLSPGLTTCFLIGLGFLFTACQKPKPSFDLIITGGQVIDGTGSAPFPADIGITGGRIREIGDLGRRSSQEKIDATGLVVAPGFIDLHTHAERELPDFPDVRNFTRQGVTTVVGGNCGGSPYPVGDYLDQAEAKGIAVNLALLVGHNTVRREVMGTQNRYSRPNELAQMENLVDQAMRDGAFGLSTGLLYVPGAYSDTREVIALAEVAARHGGFYATHMRNEGLKLIEGLTEALNIGREAQLPVHISHHKAVGKSMWGGSVQTLEMVDAAVAEGLDVTLDQYPYTASSTGLTVLFPAWSLEGGREEILKRLADPNMRERIKEAIVRGIRYDRGGGDPASIVVARFESDKTLEGKNLAEITELQGRKPTPENAAETLMELIEEGGGSGIYHCMHEDDVERIMQHPRVMCASDGATREFGVSKPHPRNYGTFPRVLGHYVREKHILTLTEAVRKMTSLPAQRLGLTDRGTLKEGNWADIVLFNPRTVIDTATWMEPHQFPEGMPYLIVNGEMVIKENEWTGAFPGKVLRKNRPLEPEGEPEPGDNA